jgi:hypothetical protein
MKPSLYDGAFAVRAFKPWRIQYCITAKEFCDLCTEYVKQRLAIPVEFEMTKSDNYKGELTFKLGKNSSGEKFTTEERKEMVTTLARLEFDNSRPFNNFDIMAISLFGASGSSSECTAEMVDDADDGPHVFAYIDFKDYLKVNGPTAERVSNQLTQGNDH